MNPEKYFSVENGREVMLGKLYDLKAAVDFAEKNRKKAEWSRRQSAASCRTLS